MNITENRKLKANKNQLRPNKREYEKVIKKYHLIDIIHGVNCFLSELKKKSAFDYDIYLAGYFFNYADITEPKMKIDFYFPSRIEFDIALKSSINKETGDIDIDNENFKTVDCFVAYPPIGLCSLLENLPQEVIIKNCLFHLAREILVKTNQSISDMEQEYQKFKNNYQDLFLEKYGSEIDFSTITRIKSILN